MSNNQILDFAIVGSTAVGKTSLIQSLSRLSQHRSPLSKEIISQQMANPYQPSSEYGENEVTLIVHSTHGILNVNCFVAMTAPIDRHYDGILILLNELEESSIVKASEWYQRTLIERPDVAVLVCANKVDLQEDLELGFRAERSELTQQLLDQLPNTYQTYRFVSSSVAHDCADNREVYTDSPQLKALEALCREVMQCNEMHFLDNCPVDSVLVLSNIKQKPTRQRRLFTRQKPKCHFDATKSRVSHNNNNKQSFSEEKMDEKLQANKNTASQATTTTTQPRSVFSYLYSWIF
jgi:GTPase SAR1 family protein